MPLSQKRILKVRIARIVLISGQGGRMVLILTCASMARRYSANPVDCHKLQNTRYWLLEPCYAYLVIYNRTLREDSDLKSWPGAVRCWTLEVILKIVLQDAMASW